MILTSGTTGTPKGAPRGESGLDGAVALLSKMPFRRLARPTSQRRCSTPGAGHTSTWRCCSARRSCCVAGSTPPTASRPSQEYDVDALIVIPVMMQRIMKLPEDKRSGDYSKLKVVAASGSALPGDLATEWMDAFGDNLYNTYGSTEVAWATIAQPKDMRAAPARPARRRTTPW